VSRQTNYASTLCAWSSHPKDELPKQVFMRQALAMTWDYAETNLFSSSGGNFDKVLMYTSRALASVPASGGGEATQGDSALFDEARQSVRTVVSTDPPYYDNIGYSELSDYFYVWLRHSLKRVLPSLFGTLLTPKQKELVATPARFAGGQKQADDFFENGLHAAFQNMIRTHDGAYVFTVFYAFKQTEVTIRGAGDVQVASTGWETMLSGLLGAGWEVVGTWPVRTELVAALKKSVSALASSIVLACRKRPANAPAITRTDFRRLLRQELPRAIKALQKGNIAPVDMAQASIGPGMAIFSRHSRVVEADGLPMTVRTALQMINEALDEYLAEQTGEFGPDTRFAVTWFETRGFEAGPFWEAETLAKARNVSVEGIQQAGILHSSAGKVRLLRRDEIPDEWEPETDPRITIWECTQHLIKRLEHQGEQAAADLLARLGSRAEPAHDLAYRLYQTCIRKGWAEEAHAYNSLGAAWLELTRLAAQRKTKGPIQESLL